MIQHAFRDNVDAQTVRLDLFLHVLQRMFDASSGYHTASVPLTLLFATVLKIDQSARTVQLLADQGFVEEILAVSHTLVESTVNAAYLQYADSRELDHYLHFQPEAAYRHNALVRQRQQSTSSKIVRVLQSLVRVGDRSNTNQTAPEWTRRSLLERAQVTDAISNIPVLTLLVERCYPKGHAAVHGAVGSLDNFITMLTSNGPRHENRLADLSEALFGINLCLLTLCMFLNMYLGLNMDEGIDEAANATSMTKPSLANATVSWH